MLHGDLSLVINQVAETWKIRSDNLAPYQAKIEELKKFFDDIMYVHLPSDENQFIDALPKLAALINIPDHMDIMPVCVKRCYEPAYTNTIGDDRETEFEPWCQAILKYKESGEYPPDTGIRGKQAIRMLVAQFVRTNDGQLYKKTAQDILLRCIDMPTAKRVMEEVQDGECGPQMNSHMLVRKIRRLGYYWTMMETDFCK
ncbi:uncharacterized protein LOC141617371 [Silene latifolia]|uniref:uncharacterized protein LOC141617371 n=1 Tax=Silene latifolia TaxID=37657 RepID=UPI003D7814B2